MVAADVSGLFSRVSAQSANFSGLFWVVRPLMKPIKTGLHVLFLMIAATESW